LFQKKEKKKKGEKEEEEVRYNSDGVSFQTSSLFPSRSIRKEIMLVPSKVRKWN